MSDRRGWWTSLRVRLTVLYVLLITLATAALGFQVYRWTAGDLLAERRVRLLTEARMTADAVAGVIDSELGGAHPTLENYARRFETRILLVDGGGRVRSDSLRESAPEESLEGETLGYMEVESALAGDAAAGVYRLRDDQYVMYAGVPVVRGGEMEGAILMADSLAEIVSSLTTLVHRLIAAGLAINLGVAVATWLVAHRLTSPLVRLTRTARRLGSGDLGARVKVTARDETGDLTETFNEMARQLQEHDRMQRRFISDASHELRSPVASALLLLEALEDPQEGADESLRVGLKEQLERMSRLVNQLLELARLQEWEVDAEIPDEPADAGHVVRRVLRRLQPLAAPRGVELRKHVDPTPPVSGSEDNLDRIVQNLVENALKYTPEGGVVCVAVTRAPPPESTVRLTVRDNGPGIPAEDLPHIFDRFYRTDAARSRGEGGFGLGLAIVQRRVRAVGGSVEVQSGPEGGTTFSVLLPAVCTRSDGEPECG